MENTTAKRLITTLPSPTAFTADQMGQYLRVVKIVFLCTISLVGITGNVIICKKLIRRKCKPSEYFIINLAFADLNVCAMGIPLDIYEQLHDTWQYGGFLCKIIWPYQTLLVLVSIMTLTAMSLERHRAIMTPFKPRLKKSDLLKAIACVWIIGLCVIAPYINYLTYKNQNCMENWPMEMSGAYYTLSLFVIDYCIPLTIITYCYTRAGLRLYENSSRMQRMNSASAVASIAQQKRLHGNTRVIKRFSFAVLMFLVCMLPGDCYWMWKSFGKDTSAFANEEHFRTFANILVYANSAINPFIFGACQVGCSKDSGNTRRFLRVLSLQIDGTATGQMSMNNNNLKKDECDEEKINIVGLDDLRETNV